MRLVIADIHGNREALDAILRWEKFINYNADLKLEVASGREIDEKKRMRMEYLHNKISSEHVTEWVILGDIVNRGKDSAYCIDKLIEKYKEGLVNISIRGNHEDMILGALKLKDKNKGNTDGLEGVLRTTFKIKSDLAFDVIDTVEQLFGDTTYTEMEEMRTMFDELYVKIKKQLDSGNVSSLKTAIANYVKNKRVNDKQVDYRRVLEEISNDSTSFWFYDFAADNVGLVSKETGKQIKIDSDKFTAFRRYMFINKQAQYVDEEVVDTKNDEENHVKIRWAHGEPFRTDEEEEPNTVYVYPSEFEKNNHPTYDDYAAVLMGEGISESWTAHTHRQGKSEIEVGKWGGKWYLDNASTRKKMRKKGIDQELSATVLNYNPGSVGNSRDPSKDNRDSDLKVSCAVRTTSGYVQLLKFSSDDLKQQVWEP